MHLTLMLDGESQVLNAIDPSTPTVDGVASRAKRNYCRNPRLHACGKSHRRCGEGDDQIACRSGRSAARSSVSKTERREPARSWKGRVLTRSSRSAIAALSLGECREAVVAKRRHDLALDDEHATLRFRLVPRLRHARRQDRRAVMGGEVLIGRVELGLVEARVGHAGPEIVGHDQRGHAAEVLHHPHVRRDPVGQLLRPGGVGEEEMARAQRPHEDLRLPHLPRLAVQDFHRRPGIIDETARPRLVLLAEHRIEAGGPGVVARTELRVLIAPRARRGPVVRLLVFHRQELVTPVRFNSR